MKIPPVFLSTFPLCLETYNILIALNSWANAKLRWWRDDDAQNRNTDNNLCALCALFNTCTHSKQYGTTPTTKDDDDDDDDEEDVKMKPLDLNINICQQNKCTSIVYFLSVAKRQHTNARNKVESSETHTKCILCALDRCSTRSSLGLGVERRVLSLTPRCSPLELSFWCDWM